MVFHYISIISKYTTIKIPHGNTILTVSFPLTSMIVRFESIPSNSRLLSYLTVFLTKMAVLEIIELFSISMLNPGIDDFDSMLLPSLEVCRVSIQFYTNLFPLF